LVFRLAAVILGLMPFLAVEGLFALFDWGRPSYADDPFVGFRAFHPLFVLNEDGTRYDVAKSRQGYFRPESFAREKGPDELRIFCLGGSTVQGRPFAIETSFTTWLELSLQAGQPDRQWEVVNCGGVSYASYRLVPILEEVLGYQPDLIVIYTGHNEFLEDRTYAHVKYMPEIVARPCELVVQTRTYTLLREGYVRLRGRSDEAQRDRPMLQAEVDAMLDHRGGLEQYHRDEKWRRDVIEHFRFNLRRMVHIAQQAGVPLILMNPVSNLRDCPPFKSEHRDGLTPEELETWEKLVDKAKERQKTNMYEAMITYQEALKIDDQHAGLHYLLGKCYDALGMTDEARASYLQAKELDVCPLRILEPMSQAVVEVAAETDTPLVDVRRLYEERSQFGIPGGYWLIDHVHPSIPGHQLIANALADEIARQAFFHPQPDWQKTRDRRFREHLASLDDLYFAKGEERLARVRRWTQGRSRGLLPRRPPD
jgi:lysophospholipase L1-like esterase